MIKMMSSMSAALVLGSGIVTLDAGVTLELQSRYPDPPVAALFDESAAEIVAYDKMSKRLFVTNSGTDAIDVIDISDVTAPELITSIDLESYLEDAGPTSVAVNPRPGRHEIAVALRAPLSPGKVVFFSTDGTYLASADVGIEPDKIGYSPNGRYVVTANEAESLETEDGPGAIDDFDGSLTIIDVTKPLRQLNQTKDVQTIGFDAFNSVRDDLIAAEVRIHPAAGTVAQDLEPEYFTFSEDSKTAWVTLQENNAVAEVDLQTNEVVAIIPLGAKDYSLEGNGLDPSNRDDGINIANWPVYGLYMPDAIASYKVEGETFLVTANEGDTRDDFDTERIKDLDLDPLAFPDAAWLQEDEQLGRLNASIIDGLNSDGTYSELYSYGARSFSIWKTDGTLVFDSGDQFEQITAAYFPDDFNSTDNENDSFDNRSDDKGPEPEGVTLGKIGGHTYAFVTLERTGGIMIYDVTDPYSPSWCDYVNTREFAGNPEAGTAGDLAPEGIEFIAAGDSPSGFPLVVVANEVSGTTSIFAVKPLP
ncbi:MAG: choice-of-anchor I family protein [Verrucomicrobiales bacterium]